MMNRIIGILGLIVIIFACRPAKRDTAEDNRKEADETMVKINKILVGKDAERIRAYIKRRNWNMTESKSGLWYMVTEEGRGKKAETGDLVTINYTVELLDGTLCYSSDSLGPKTFKIGQGGVESGLEEGILLLHDGSRARFILPPHLAHGLIGDENRIPSRSVIVYDVYVVKLENNSVVN